MMKRQATYGNDSNINNNNPYVAPSDRRMQHGGGTNSFPGPYTADAAEHPYKSSNVVEGMWQWDRDAQNVSSQVPSLGFPEGQGGNVTGSYYHGQTPEAKMGVEDQTNKEARTLPHEQDMEIGYEESTLPMTYDSLERKFLDDVMKLVKEHSDAEDAENTRHREKIIEINSRYQEKLSTLRAQQTNRREEFLHKESEARLSQYQQAGISHYQNTGLQDARGYGGVPAAGATEDVHQSYGINQFESYRGRPPFVGTQGTEGRVPFPEGRVYGNSGSRYY